jgi:hypothetical protein
MSTFQYSLAIYPVNNLSMFINSPFDSVAKQVALLNQYRASIGAVFSAQDIGLVQANVSSEAFDIAIQRVGGTSEAVKMTKRYLWRNVRIPFLHSLPRYEKTRFDWTVVPMDMISDYSSLIGLRRGWYTLFDS